MSGRTREDIILKRSACDGKKRFLTYREALCMIRNHEVREPMRPYRCRYCHYFHIGGHL